MLRARAVARRATKKTKKKKRPLHSMAPQRLRRAPPTSLRLLPPSRPPSLLPCSGAAPDRLTMRRVDHGGRAAGAAGSSPRRADARACSPSACAPTKRPVAPRRPVPPATRSRRVRRRRLGGTSIRVEAGRKMGRAATPPGARSLGTADAASGGSSSSPLVDGSSVFEGSWWGTPSPTARASGRRAGARRGDGGRASSSSPVMPPSFNSAALANAYDRSEATRGALQRRSRAYTRAPPLGLHRFLRARGRAHTRSGGCPSGADHTPPLPSKAAGVRAPTQPRTPAHPGAPSRTQTCPPVQAPTRAWMRSPSQSSTPRPTSRPRMPWQAVRARSLR